MHMRMGDEDFREDTALQKEANPSEQASQRKRILGTPVPLKWGVGGGPSAQAAALAG